MSDVALSVGEKFGTYGKAFSGAVVAGLGAYSTAVQDGPGVTAAEWIAVVLAFLASFGIIWSIPMTPKIFATYGKLVFSGIAAAGSALITGLLDGSLDQVEVITALVAFALASGLTGTVSNAAASDPVDARGRLVAIPASVKAAMVDVNEPTRVVHRGQLISLAHDDPARGVEHPEPAEDDPHAAIKYSTDDQADDHRSI